MARIPDTIAVASLDTHALIVTVPYDGPADVASSLPRSAAADVLRQLADRLEAQPCPTAAVTGMPCPVHDAPTAPAEEQPPAEEAPPVEGDRYVKRAEPDEGRVVTVTNVWTADDGHTAVAYKWQDPRASYAGSACPLDVFRRTYRPAIEQPDDRAEVDQLRDDLEAKRQDHEAAVKGWGRARDRLAELEAATARALAVHVEAPDSEHCQHDGEQWPCPTVAALDPAKADQLAAKAQAYRAAALEVDSLPIPPAAAEAGPVPTRAARLALSYAADALRAMADEMTAAL